MNRKSIAKKEKIIRVNKGKRWGNCHREIKD